MMGLRAFRRRLTAPAPHENGEVVDFHSAARSDVGRRRTVNEDRVLDRPDRGLWAVADGMGGHSGGDVAATIAIGELSRLADGAGTISEDAIRRALGAAHDAIAAHARQSGGIAGTTIVVACAVEADVTVLWAGDSRVYHLATSASLVTHDHSLVQDLVDAGVLTDDQAKHHPQSNVITRALGIGDTLAIDARAITLGYEERLLLCSDGVSRSIAPEDFRSLAAQEIAHAADNMLHNALARDGTDNASLVLVERARRLS